MAKIKAIQTAASPQTLGAALAANSPEDVAAIKAAALDAGKEILAAIGGLNDAAAGVFGLILAAVCSGISFDSMEDAVPALKEQGAYRTAKSLIRKARKAGASLSPDMTAGEVRKAGDKARDPAETRGKGRGAAEPTAPHAAQDNADGAPAHLKFATNGDMLRGAFALLQKDADSREEFADLLIKLAAQVKAERAAAQDEARREKIAA